MGIYSRHAMHMVAALTGCRMALVSTNECRNHSSPLVGVPLPVVYTYIPRLVTLGHWV